MSLEKDIEEAADAVLVTRAKVGEFCTKLAEIADATSSLVEEVASYTDATTKLNQLLFDVIEEHNILD